MKSSPESPVEFLAPLSRPPERVYVAEMETPFGPLALAGDGDALLHARMDAPLPALIQDLHQEWDAAVVVEEAPFRDVIRQLRDWLDGCTAPIRARVRTVGETPFTTAIHRRIACIPFGETLSYGDLALAAGCPRAFRAAGSACGRNRALLVVPCHRVVASNGIGGFGARLDLKRAFLRHEGVEYEERALRSKGTASHRSPFPRRGER